jgi:hypothetical protein
MKFEDLEIDFLKIFCFHKPSESLNVLGCLIHSWRLSTWWMRPATEEGEAVLCLIHQSTDNWGKVIPNLVSRFCSKSAERTCKLLVTASLYLKEEFRCFGKGDHLVLNFFLTRAMIYSFYKSVNRYNFQWLLTNIFPLSISSSANYLWGIIEI